MEAVVRLPACLPTLQHFAQESWGLRPGYRQLITYSVFCWNNSQVPSFKGCLLSHYHPPARGSLGLINIYMELTNMPAGRKKITLEPEPVLAQRATKALIKGGLTGVGKLVVQENPMRVYRGLLANPREADEVQQHQ